MTDKPTVEQALKWADSIQANLVASQQPGVFTRKFFSRNPGVLAAEVRTLRAELAKEREWIDRAVASCAAKRCSMRERDMKELEQAHAEALDLLEIGDKVWIAWGTSHHLEEGVCDVCFGRGKVQIVTGDGSLWAVNCGNCGKGGEKPSGKAFHRVARWGVKEAEVCGIDATGDDVRYTYRPYISDMLGAFDTKEEAEACAFGKSQELVEHRNMIDAKIPHDRWDSATWSLGYHRAQIRDAERTIAWHESQIEKMKPPNDPHP